MSEEQPKPKTIKKRGRKPKQKQTIANVPKTRKKRGRKPKQRVYKYETKPNEIVDTNIILRLPIKVNTVKEENIDSIYLNDSFTQSIMKEIPSNPLPSNSNMSIQNKNIHHYKNLKTTSTPEVIEDTVSNKLSLSMSGNKLLNTIQTDNQQSIFQSETEDTSVYSDTINSQIHDKLKTYSQCKQEPKINVQKKNICCFWCCHTFTCKPCSIPFQYIDKTFHVYGNFCSPECASAYLFDMDTNETVWEKYSLLNLMWNKIYKNQQYIKKALPRTTLQMFGGNLSIQEFRSYHNQYREEHKLQFPPLLPIKSNLEKYSIASLHKKKFIPLDDTRVQKAKRNLKLSRKKPLQSNMNTLEQCMNLQYN